MFYGNLSELNGQSSNNVQFSDKVTGKSNVRSIECGTAMSQYVMSHLQKLDKVPVLTIHLPKKVQNAGLG